MCFVKSRLAHKTGDKVWYLPPGRWALGSTRGRAQTMYSVKPCCTHDTESKGWQRPNERQSAVERGTHRPYAAVKGVEFRKRALCENVMHTRGSKQGVPSPRTLGSSVGSKHFLFFSFRRTSSQRTLASKTHLEVTIVQPRVP